MKHRRLCTALLLAAAFRPVASADFCGLTITAGTGTSGLGGVLTALFLPGADVLLGASLFNFDPQRQFDDSRYDVDGDAWSDLRSRTVFSISFLYRF
jgi:hypothetical protein